MELDLADFRMPSDDGILQVIDHLRGTARPGYRQHLDLAW
jgi:hypothetical protein